MSHTHFQGLRYKGAEGALANPEFRGAEEVTETDNLLMLAPKILTGFQRRMGNK